MSSGCFGLTLAANFRGHCRPYGANGALLDLDGNILQALKNLDIQQRIFTDAQIHRIIRYRGTVATCFDLNATVITSGRRYPNTLAVVKKFLRPRQIHLKLYGDWLSQSQH